MIWKTALNTKSTSIIVINIIKIIFMDFGSNEYIRGKEFVNNK